MFIPPINGIYRLYRWSIAIFIIFLLQVFFVLWPSVRLQRYISLPRIAAIGTQSSGKSSLIESIVGWGARVQHLGDFRAVSSILDRSHEFYAIENWVNKGTTQKKLERVSTCVSICILQKFSKPLNKFAGTKITLFTNSKPKVSIFSEESSGLGGKSLKTHLFFVWWFHRRAHTFDGTCPFAFHGLLNRRSGGIFHKTHIYDQSEHIVQNIYMQSLEITVLLGRYSSRSIPIIMLRWNGNWCFTVKHPLEQNCRSITDLHTPSILIFDNRKEKTSK